MTAQVADIVLFEGDNKSLFTNPLEQLWEIDGFTRPKFGHRRTSNRKGYIAYWEVIDNTLYLTGIKSDDESELKDFFPETNGNPVKAWWFTGELCIVQGSAINYVHGGYASTFEKETYLVVRKGEVKDVNTKFFSDEDFRRNKTRKELRQNIKTRKMVSETLKNLKKKKKVSQKRIPQLIKKPDIQKLRRLIKSRIAQRRAVTFLVRHPDFFIDHISGSYPLTDELIDAYTDLWNWNLMSGNPFLVCSDEVTEKDRHRLNWKDSDVFEDANITSDGKRWMSTSEYNEKINKIILAKRDDLLKKCLASIDGETEKEHLHYMSCVDHLRFTNEIRKQYKAYIDYKIMSGKAPDNLTNEIQKIFSLKWDKNRYIESDDDQLANNEETGTGQKKEASILIPKWHLPDIENEPKYTKKEMEDMLVDPDWNKLSKDTCVPWTEELIDRYVDHWEWGHDKVKHNEWIEICSGLSTNPSLPWSVKFIEKYSNKINWKHLSMNEGIPWNLSLIKRFRKNWMWELLKWNETMWINVFYSDLEEDNINRIMVAIKNKRK